MSRALRIWQNEFPYSITTRINNREFHLKDRTVDRIFRKIFRLLSEVQVIDPISGKKAQKYVFVIHHFLIMSNHYHLIISTPSGTRIDRIMQLINSLAARAINRKLGRSGHLWGDRYKMRILHSMEYLKRSIGYLYQNPVRANIVTTPVEYERSTLSIYLENEVPHPKWFGPDEWINSIGSNIKDALLELLRTTILKKHVLDTI